jgi:hypothetical protein
VALVLVAGGIVGANITDRMASPIPASRDLFEINGMNVQYGWPIVAEEIWQTVIRSPGEPLHLRSKWNATGIIVDSVVAVSIFLVAALILEWLVRGSEAQRI